jgi:hypothetical protein
MLIPRLVTTRNVATDASVSSTALLGYAKLVLDPVAVKIEGTYGGNLSDMLMLGGYAVKSIDAVSGIEEYLALKCYSFWGEISTGKDLELALFAGYSKNCGASDNLTGTFYGRGTDIDAIFRISPRVAWHVGKVRFASEFEYTSAGYGTPNSLNKGTVENVKNVANARLLLAAYYFF